jgi:hypothetical protein
MNRRLGLLVGAVAVIAAACSSSGSGGAPPRVDRPRPAGSGGAGCTVGVSWNNFQQPRWAAHDKPNIQKTVEAGGGKYIDADAT